MDGILTRMSAIICPICKKKFGMQKIISFLAWFLISISKRNMTHKHTSQALNYSKFLVSGTLYEYMDLYDKMVNSTVKCDCVTTYYRVVY